MWSRVQSSRRRYRQYRQELKNRWQERHSSTQLLEPGSLAAAEAGTDKTKHIRQRTFFELFRHFWSVLGDNKTNLIAALGYLTVATLLGLIPVYGTKLVIDNALGGQPLPPTLAGILESVGLPQPEPRILLSFVALGMFTIAFLAVVVGICGRWQATKITKLIQVSVRKRAFEHASRLPLHRVYQLKSGGAASLLRDDAGQVGELVFSMIYNPWRAIIQLTGSLAILTYTDWRLFLGSLFVLPSVWLTHKTWIGRIRPIYRDIRATRQFTDGHATEAFGGMRVVRSFARQRSEAAQFTRNNHLMARQEIFVWWWSRGVDIAWSLFIPAATAVLLWYGGTRILDDAALVAAGELTPEKALTIGSLVMFITYLGWLLGPLEALAHSATAFQNSLAALDRVLNLFSEQPEMPDRPGAKVVSPNHVYGRITLRNVGFTYPGNEEPVLENINLDVQPGQMIALVGPSGAGKTTLCNLVARFFDPTDGSIELDGVNLRDITLDSYRGLLGIVEQDTFLFDGTVAENIGYGRRHAAMEQVISAAQQANADEFIRNLPEGYETRIGERGVKLSGGQRQRLTIARAILADPRILILDEATSNLDTESERLIQASLHSLMADRTSFVIAHRLSTIMHADLIVVVDEGRILEQGQHEQLMARSGRYRHMVEVQTQPPARLKRVSDSAAASDSTDNHP